MKTNINKAVVVFAAIAVLAGSVPGVSRTAFAAENGSTSTVSGTSVCTRITDVAATTAKRLGEREGRYNTTQDNRLTNIDNRENKQNDRLSATRTKQDEGRVEQYGKLEGKAKTDAQKAAVKTFEATVDAAKIVRRTAVDSAVSTFRTALDSAIAARKAQVDAALATFKTSVNAAIDKAKADCASGVDPKIVKSTLQASTEAARVKLASDRKAIEKLGDVVSPLAKVRNAAVAQAGKTFKAAVDAARTVLQAAFK